MTKYAGTYQAGRNARVFVKKPGTDLIKHAVIEHDVIFGREGGPEMQIRWGQIENPKGNEDFIKFIGIRTSTRKTS